MITADKVYALVKQKGPIIPNDIKRELGEGDTFIIGAVLSELADAKKIKISHVKIGGSPFYYAEGQEYKLQELSKHLNEKDLRAYELLRKNIALRDKELEPLMRVAMRAIKDYAKPLEVRVHGQTELFWKWYLTSNSDAEPRIREIAGAVKPEERPSESGSAEQKPVKEKEEPKEKQIEKEEKKIDAEKKEAAREIKKDEATSEFLEQIKRYFKKNEIEVLETNIIKKSSEADFVIKLPSVVGTLKYYCKARNKKKSNDKDLSAAYVKGEGKKLPILYLTTGELTKQAEKMLEAEFKNIKVKRI